MPGVDELFLNLISLEYHQLLMAASGKEAEKTLSEAIRRHAGRYLLIVEGAIPGAGQEHCLKIAGHPATEILRKASADAAVVIAMGSCASWGGIVAAEPSPTAATGIAEHAGGKLLINIPGCPPNPYVLIATILEYAVASRFPALDDQHRPLFAFDRFIHEHCPRRGHFEAGRIARHFGDAKHRKGYCLFGLGCKGPITHAACSTRHFNEIPDCWPIGIGAPCFGCTESKIAFRMPVYQLVILEEDPL
jgi:hydrogenase small subunit